MMIMIVYSTPERHLPTSRQHGHSPQRHTAAGTAAPHHHRHGEHSPPAISNRGRGYARTTRGEQIGEERAHTASKPVGGWPLHNIVMTNIVWCMAYKRGSKGGRILRISRAKVLK